MNYILIFFYSILSTISANQSAQNQQHTPKFCVDCKFCKKPFLSSSEFAKCSLFPLVKESDSFLVNRNEDNYVDYLYCSILRNSDDYCGRDGKYYEKSRFKK